ncbi:MAG TPA: peptidoglycan-binding domain-containing protein [Methylomirabilota bacterium]|nr:peptidoglycan-binding domain-containing protein [Methylomirabilota bacterium]
MLRTKSIIGALALLALPQAAAAEDAQIGCFTDGDYVYLHGGLTYQYFIAKGDKPVDCSPDAVKIGLELAEEAVQVSCVTNPDSLCDEKKQYVQLIHSTYDKMLNGSSAAAAPAPDTAAQAAATAPAAGDAAPAAPPADGSTQAATPSDSTAQTAANADTATQVAVAPPPVNLRSRDTIRWVQASLQQLGYDAGKVDGAVGRRTAVAIKKYEKDSGLPITGKMSAALVDSLRKRTGQQ